MLRGSTLFDNLFSTASPEAANELCAQRKGRSSELNQKRNECLIARYYWVCETTKWRYDVVVLHIADEFFLSPHTITEIITDSENLRYLRSIKQSKFDVKYFKRKWPHLDWSAKALNLFN